MSEVKSRKRFCMWVVVMGVVQTRKIWDAVGGYKELMAEGDHFRYERGERETVKSSLSLILSYHRNVQSMDMIPILQCTQVSCPRFAQIKENLHVSYYFLATDRKFQNGRALLLMMELKYIRYNLVILISNNMSMLMCF